MAFVYTFWYIVMILLVAGIVACLTVFFKMDKKDKVLIDEFIKQSAQPNDANAEKQEIKSAEESKE